MRRRHYNDKVAKAIALAASGILTLTTAVGAMPVSTFAEEDAVTEVTIDGGQVTIIPVEMGDDDSAVEDADAEETTEKTLADVFAEIERPAESDTVTVGPVESEDAEGEDADWSVFYDETTGSYKVNYNIEEEAEGDQTLDLSQVMAVFNAWGSNEAESMLDSFLEDCGMNSVDEFLEKYSTAQSIKVTPDEDDANYNAAYIYPSTRTMIIYLTNDQAFSIDLDSLQAIVTMQPGDTFDFDVTVSSDSQHTYTYKSDSLTVSTPDLSSKVDEDDTIEGFDGQILPEENTRATLTVGYNQNMDDHNVMNDLVDKAIEAAIQEGGKLANNLTSYSSYYVQTDGSISTTKTTATYDAGTELVKIGSKYYVKNGEYYVYISSPSVISTTDEEGNTTYTLKSKKSNVTTTAYDENGVKVPVYYTRNNASSSNVKSAVTSYLETYYDGSYEEYILAYYNKQDGTAYTSLNDLLAGNDAASATLYGTTARSLASLTVNSAANYNNFYQSILSLVIGDAEDVEAYEEQYDPEWASKEGEHTIADYMIDKLNETEGAWDTANEYFEELTANGISADEATWVAFVLSVNLDGYNAGNGYQDSKWSWYASIVLEQVDGTLELVKTDKSGNTIGDDASEDQTSFYIWTIDNEDGTDVYYYLLGNESDGYSFAKYDDTNSTMNWYITTENGGLGIDYAMLEGYVYYIQEAVAPKGYEIDTNIYILCSEEDYEALKEAGAIDADGNVYNKATDTSSKAVYTGAEIIGGETVSIKFVNTDIPVTPEETPDPTPETPSTPEEPETPDTPVTPETPAYTYEVPTAEVLGATRTTESSVLGASRGVLGATRTGDEANAGAWLAVFVAASASILLAGAMIVLRKKLGR